eukprot:gene30746-922_t
MGHKVRVKCNEDDTVGDLKKLCAAQIDHAQIGTRPEKLRIQKWYTVYKDHITLSDYEIKDGMGLDAKGVVTCDGPLPPPYTRTGKRDPFVLLAGTPFPGRRRAAAVRGMSRAHHHSVGYDGRAHQRGEGVAQPVDGSWDDGDEQAAAPATAEQARRAALATAE